MSGRVMLLILSFLFASTLFPADSSALELKDKFWELVRAGNREFENKQYKNALKKYQAAQLENMASKEVDFNIGNVYYRQKKYVEAEETFLKVADSKDDAIRQKAWYNLGNTYFQQNKFLEAINAYVEALKIDPDDPEAKFNLEYCRIRLREEAEKKRKEEEKKKKQKDKEKNRIPPEDEKKDEKKQCPNPQQGDKQKQEQKKQGDQKGGDEKKEEQQKQPKPQPQPGQQEKKEEKMGKEEALRLLKLAEGEEKDKKKTIQVPVTAIPGGKDW